MPIFLGCTSSTLQKTTATNAKNAGFPSILSRWKKNGGKEQTQIPCTLQQRRLHILDGRSSPLSKRLDRRRRRRAVGARWTIQLSTARGATDLKRIGRRRRRKRKSCRIERSKWRWVRVCNNAREPAQCAGDASSHGWTAMPNPKWGLREREERGGDDLFRVPQNPPTLYSLEEYYVFSTTKAKCCIKLEASVLIE